MTPLTADERRRLAEIERGLTADRDRPKMRRGRERPMIPPVLLVAWVTGGLMFGALLSARTGLALAAGAILTGAALVGAYRHRRRQRPVARMFGGAPWTAN